MRYEGKPLSKPLSCLCKMTYAANKWLYHTKIHDWPSQTALLVGWPFSDAAKKRGTAVLEVRRRTSMAARVSCSAHAQQRLFGLAGRAVR
jgi:hypothetical protein